MDVVHEAVHAWLRARSPRGRPLPLWVEEGLAGMVSQEGAFDTKEWCRGLLAAADQNGIDPLFPAEVMEVPDTASLAALVKARAPCDERPYTLIPVFHAHAESLVAFLLEDHPGCVHRAGFLDWLGRHLSGAPLPESPDGPAFAAARAFGFESPEALFRARDGWLGE
ncbi:MAG: hypothetical protein HUU06_11455 [Planctomycetaceae bacterium]|nr:hypothetical protein [Planctomycetaceae bacterium]